MTAIRTMPHDPVAEETVLAAVLTGGIPTLDELDLLTPEHFYVRGNRIIFETCRALRDAASAIESGSVIGKLKDLGRLEEVGGVFRLAQIESGYITTSNVGFYAQRLDEKLAMRRVIEMGTRAVQLAYEKQDEPEAVLAEVEVDATKLRESGKVDANDLEAGCNELIEDITVREDAKHGRLAIATGVAAWDEMFFGLMPGRQYLVAGRPGLGKTALAEQICANIVCAGEQVLFISLEMERRRLLGRIVARKTGTDYGKWLRGYPSREESARMRLAVEDIRKTKLHLWAPNSATPQQCRGLIRRAARKGVKVFMLDYFSRLDIGGSRDKRNEAFASAAALITRAIKESGCAGIVLAQLNRESEKETLRLGHLGETSQLEKDADGVLMLDCNDMKASPREVVFQVEKNRDGACGKATMLFDGPTMEFRSKSQS